MQIGSWTGNIYLLVVPMDDFLAVLGLKFMNEVKAVPMPFISSMVFMNGPSFTWYLPFLEVHWEVISIGHVA